MVWADSGDIPGQPWAISRARWLSRSAAGALALSAAGAAFGAIAAAKPSSALSARDRRVLDFLLTLEHLAAGFYAEALRAGTLTGEERLFAETAGAEERAHVRYLSGLLGAAGARRRYRFGHAVGTTADFVAAAVTIEETVLASYNGQAANLSRHTLAKVARIMSVESRHAAWARGLAGKLPAPVAADVPIDAVAAMNAIKPFLAE